MDDTLWPLNGVSLNEPILASMSGGPRKKVVPASVERVVESLSLFDGGSVKDAGNAGKASDEVLKTWTFGSGDVRGVELGWAENASKLGKLGPTVLCELSSSIGSRFPETGLL